jgi:hypothetical protein
MVKLRIYKAAEANICVRNSHIDLVDNVVNSMNKKMRKIKSNKMHV